MKTPIVLDCDITLGVRGLDIGAGMALLYVLGIDSLDLLGVTTTFGAASVDIAHRQAKWMLRMLEREEIPVFSGAPGPQGGSTEAAHFLAKTIRQHPGEVSIVATGPLGNLSRAAQVYDGFFAHLRRIVCLGGWLHPPPRRRTEEIGFSRDPAAALAVLSSGCVPVVMTSELCSSVPFRRSVVARAGFWPAWLRDFVRREMRGPRWGGGLWQRYLPEVIPATYMVRPELFEDRTRSCAPGVDDLGRGEMPPADHGSGLRVNMPVRLRSPQSLALHVLEAWARAVGGPA